VYAAIRHQRADGSVIYVDEHGQPLGDYFLKYPLSYSRITSVYSDSRMHPVLRIKRPHYGVDFAAPIGTPVRSIGDGIVKEASYKGSAGRMIRIEHNSTYATAYLHLHSIKSNIRPGMRVARGEVIGTVGQTGLASGPHLHFSLYKNGKYVDPLSEKLHWEMPLKDRIDPKVLRVTLRELGTFHQAYLRRVSVVDKGQGAGGSTDLSHGDLMHKMVLAHNVNDDVASMVNQGAKPHNHHRLGDELDVILEDPRLQLKGNRGKPCDSLNVFACSPR
jgi:murein DD-endopeptidase MepM/ murein hydrolase activator NlpD